jgi:MFS family permease
VLVAARIGQGHAAALLMPQALAVLGVIYEDARRIQAFSIYGMALGALSTMQQVGNALGVAITGVIFYGAIKHSLPHAFELSLAELAAVSLAVAACSRLLPRRAQG